MATHFSNLKYPHGYNVDADLVFREFSAAALSATGSSAAIAFKPDKTPAYQVVVRLGATSGVDGSNFWTLTVESDTSAAFASATVLESVRLPATAGFIEIPLVKSIAERLDPGATHLRVTATKTGTAGNLTYGAFLHQI